MAVDILAYSYAGVVAVGGVIGYVKKGSTASLGMGLLFGVVLAWGAYRTSKNPNNYWLGLCTSAILAGLMGNKYYHTGKIMPAGFIAGVSALMVIRYVWRSFAPPHS